MANPPITIGPFTNVPAPGSPIKSDWPQSISTYVDKLPLGQMGQAYGPAADAALTSGSYVDLTGATLTFTAVNGRRYKLSGAAVVATGANPAILEIGLFDGSNSLMWNTQCLIAANLVASLTVTGWASNWSGSRTVKLRAYASAAACLVHGFSARRCWVAAEDLGKP